MKEEFEKLVAAGKIGRPHVEPLLQLVQSGYCMHRSWGFGKIKSVDTIFARLTIDFPNKPGHSMDLGFAAESLKAIPSDHILARKASDIQSLRQMAALHHLDLIKLVLQSFGGRATLEQIQQVLVPDVIADDWKNWWEVGKAAGLGPAEGDLNEAAIWSQGLKLGQLLEQMPASKHKQALQSFKSATPDKWSDALLGIVNSVSAKLCTEFAHLLIHEGKLD